MSWRTQLPVRWGGCPSGWQLTRGMSEGASPVFVSHVRSCARCAAELEALTRASDQAHALAVPVMSSESRERIAAGVLIETSYLRVHAARRRGPRARRLATFAVLASAAAATVLWTRARAPVPATTSTSLASIRAMGAAVFSRLQPPPDELVLLESGTLELDVAPSGKGRRFRIMTTDAAIEAPAGSFSIEASAHTLVAVRVFRGFVDVRTPGGGHAALRAGDEWRKAPAMTPEPTPSALTTALPSGGSPAMATKIGATKIGAPLAPAERRPSRRLASPSPRALPSTPAETPAILDGASVPVRASFERGWLLLRAGQPAAAAVAFQDVDRQTRGEGIAEDAVFWQAVALARANQAADARGALSTFITRFPSSARVGEASAMLGWMLFDSGDRTGARAAFARAANDRVDRVRSSAQSGLARLAESPAVPPDPR